MPPNLPWEQADLTIQLPRSKWAQLGVTYPDGRALPNDDMPASVLLPMGRTGPAFLAYANFAAYTEWNNSLIYSTTAGYLASRIAGSPPMRRPAAPVVQLPHSEIHELQQFLVRAGFNVGKVDGVLGSRAVPPSRRCRSNTDCPRIPGRPPSCWRGCAAPRVDTPSRRSSTFSRRELAVIPVRARARTRNLEIPGSMLSHRPGMTALMGLRGSPAKSEWQAALPQ